MEYYTLQQALVAAAPALNATARHSDPLIQLSARELRAYNGYLTTIINLSDVASVRELQETVIISGDKLTKAWSDADRSRMSVTQTFMTIMRGTSSRYRLPLLDIAQFAAPTQFPEIRQAIGVEQVQAIHHAAKFASENAVHPWACGVILHNGQAIATNNKMVVAAYTGLALEGTMPYWSLALLNNEQVIHLHVDDQFTGITDVQNRVATFASALSEKPPIEVIDRTLAQLPEPHKLRRFDIATLRSAFDTVTALGGRHIEFRDKTIMVSQDDGSEAACELLNIDFIETILGIDVARLLFDNADWISFDQAPDRLIFGSDKPYSIGLAMAMRK